MHSLAFNCRSEGQLYVSSGGTEKKCIQTGALAKATESPGPRAQRLGSITSRFKAIGHRICAALNSAVNAVNRARGAWALNSINSGHATPEKIVSEMKFLRKLIGNDDDMLDAVIKWGSSEVSKPECTPTRRFFERNAAVALWSSLKEKNVESLVNKESDKELTNFYQNLCQKTGDHYKNMAKLCR